MTEETAKDIAFHMTDWLEDLQELTLFLAEPESYSDSDIHKLLIRFLSHAPDHIAAATKLYMDISVSDIFGVGAVDTDEQ